MNRLEYAIRQIETKLQTDSDKVEIPVEDAKNVLDILNDVEKSIRNIKGEGF